MTAGRCALLALCLIAYAVGIAAAAAPAVNGRTAADRRLATLYEAEWTWRMREFADPDDDMMARGGYLPHVDAASAVPA